MLCERISTVGNVWCCLVFYLLQQIKKLHRSTKSRKVSRKQTSDFNSWPKQSGNCILHVDSWMKLMLFVPPAFHWCFYFGICLWLKVIVIGLEGQRRAKRCLPGNITRGYVPWFTLPELLTYLYQTCHLLMLTHHHRTFHIW